MSFGHLGTLGTGFGRLGSSNIPVGEGWTPDELGAKLLGWWDADRDDLITESGGAVSSWKDIVAGYDAEQATGDAKPAYSADGFNGRPCLLFDGIDDQLTLASVPFPVDADAAEIWALVDQTALVADTGPRDCFAYGGSANETTRSINRVVSGGVNRARILTGTGSIVTQADAAVDFSGRHIGRGVWSATGIAIAVDGNALPTETAAVSTTGTSRTRIGARSVDAVSTLWQGSVAAILVTDALTAGEATDLAAWLNARR